MFAGSFFADFYKWPLRSIGNDKNTKTGEIGLREAKTMKPVLYINSQWYEIAL